VDRIRAEPSGIQQAASQREQAVWQRLQLEREAQAPTGRQR
jgi:hypothetical protein